MIQTNAALTLPEINLNSIIKEGEKTTWKIMQNNLRSQSITFIDFLGYA